MFQYTDSQYFVDELYGTGKSISPQIGITYAFEHSQNQSSSKSQQHHHKNGSKLSYQQAILKQQSYGNALAVENQQALCTSQVKGNILDSLLNDESANKTEQEKSFRKNHSFESLLLFIQKLKASNQQKDIQISRLQQILEKYEANRKIDIQQSTGNQQAPQMKASQSKPQMLEISRKLKDYRQKNNQLDASNKELLERLKNTEKQFDELYKSEIQYLKSQLEYQKEKNKTQKLQLQESLKNSSTQIRIKPQVRGSKDHQCDLCRQYDLLSSLSKLKGQLQQMRIKEQQLKDNLRMMSHERNRLKALLQKQANSPNTINSQRSS